MEAHRQNDRINDVDRPLPPTEFSQLKFFQVFAQSLGQPASKWNDLPCCGFCEVRARGNVATQLVLVCASRALWSTPPVANQKTLVPGGTQRA
jgi:hypothetical protein